MGLITSPVTSAWAQTPPLPTVTIRAGETESPTVIEVDFDELPLQISLDADVDNEPVSNAECTITGPKYQWSGTGIDPEEASGSGATLVFDAETVGDYTASASVSVTYKSECQDGSSSDIPLGDSASFTIKVVDVKEWSPKNQDGDEGISGGEMVKPANQSGPVTVPVYLDLGATLELEVAEASDSDRWKLAAQEGHDPDDLTYTWSSSSAGAAGSFSTTNGRVTTWTAPSTLPAGIGSISLVLSCTIDDLPKEIGADEEGNRDDDDVTRNVVVFVTRRMWDVGLAIGKGRNEQGLVFSNGRMIAPQDWRPGTPAASAVIVTPGDRIPCQVEDATDLDHWNKVPNQGEDADTVSYTWSTSDGKFAVAGENGTEILQNTVSGTNATFVVPADADEGKTITLKCKLDDAPSAVNAPDAGTRDDNAVERIVTLRVSTYKVEFSGTARACAGGIAVDGIHSFSITGTAKRTADNTLAPNTTFTLSFKNNRGHDYSNDDPGIKPENWTTNQIKKAKFVTTNGQGQQILVEELTVQTDANGQFPVTVLSSDIVSQDIKIKAAWTPVGGEPVEAGDQACRFDQAAYRRRFANPFNSTERYPEGDYGWLFQQKWLSSTNSTTTIKFYLKFMRDLSVPDQDGNWDFLPGHKIMFEIENIEDSDGNIVTATDDYVVFESTNKAHAFATTVTNDGAATSVLKAGPKIANVKTIHVKAYDESQWNE